MAKLETVASVAVIATRAKLMQEFKDRKSGEWDPNFWFGLSQGCQDVQVEVE